MKKHQHFFLSSASLPCSLLILFLFLTNCKTANNKSTSVLPETHLPEELFFVSYAMPDISMPAGVGGRSGNPSEETGMIKEAFREAYAEALLRDVKLRGILGGDLVSPWPSAAPESWSQNWENTERTPNSWGIDNLVLAVGNFEALSDLTELSGKEKAFAHVFSIHGPILDAYGKSAGYSRANGVAGYGVPLGETFYSDGAAVQRFSRGRMIVTQEGSRFSFQDDLFEYMIQSLDPEEMNVEFGGKDIPLEVSNAFIYAWAFTFSETEGKSDGPVVKISFSRPWEMEAGKELITINGFYYKSYNKSQAVLVLVDCEQLPLRARLLYGPFLKAILASKRLSGLEFERRLGTGSGTGLGRSLSDGFAVYGPPLSDPLPLPVTKIQELSPDILSGRGSAGDYQDTLFLEAQRFARGWIVVKTAREEEETAPESDEAIDDAPEIDTSTDTAPEIDLTIYPDTSADTEIFVDGDTVVDEELYADTEETPEIDREQEIDTEAEIELEPEM